MKAYFEPKMNISVFEKADVVTTSGTLGDNFSSTAPGAGNFYKTTFDNIYTTGGDISAPTNATIN